MDTSALPAPSRTTIDAEKARVHRHAPRNLGEGRLALAGLVFMQAFLGYEWLMSGLAKVVRGGFPSGLASELSAIFMNINFHLANGAAHPWLLPKSGFDEGVDLDSLMPLLQVVLLTISTSMLISLRRAARTPPVAEGAE